MPSRRNRGRPLAGRVPELAALVQALADSRDGQRGVAVLGEPGIGKTRLVEELADTALEQGCTVVWGRAAAYDDAPPFWAWRQIVRALGGTGIPFSPDRYARLETLVVLLEQRAQPAGLVVVIEDVQWLDESSRWLLVELLRLRGVDRLLLALTARLPDFDRLPVTELTRGDRVEQIRLTALEPAETARQLRSLFDATRLDEETLAAVVDRSGGNPFFAAELGRVSVAGHRTRALPVTVRETIRERLHELPASATAALDAASVLGRSFSVGLVAGMTGTTPLQTVEALEAAAEAAVLVPEDQLGTYRFAHPLMAEAIHDSLDPRSRRQLHQAAMDAIERVYADDLDDWAGELARHAAAAYVPGNQRRALQWTIRSARLAAEALAWEDAARLTRQALDVGDGSLAPDERGRLLVQLADVSFRCAQFGPAAEAVEAAMAAGSAELTALAALAVEPIGATVWDARVRRWCEAALRAADLDPGLAARLHARLAQALMYAGDLAAADAASVRAIADSRQSPGRAATIAALRSRQLVRSGPEGTAERSALARELIDAAVAGRDLPAELSARLWQLDCAFENGELDAATRALTAAAELAGRLAGPTPRWLIARGRAALRQAQGRYADALTLADDAHRSLARTGHPGADGGRLGLRAAVGRHIGHDQAGTFAALEPFERLVDEPDDPAGFVLLARVIAAGVHADAGHREIAARLLDSAGPVRGWRVPPYLRLEVWAGSVTALAGLDRRVELEIVHRRLLPYRKRFVASGGGTSFFLGPVDLHLGIAERALGRTSQAVRSLREACRLAEAAVLPGFSAEAHLELGITLRASAVSEADALLASAALDASRLGMTAVHRRADQARSAASPLTDRERDVAVLVAQGLTNRQIAQRLGLSDRTAQNHVQHILVKLGLSNRVQIASWWLDRHPA